MSTHPEKLLRRLEELGSVLSERGDALALLALGSAGRDLERLDDHSDLDFFVVVEDDAKPGYLTDTGWLEAAAPVVFDFANTVDGRKALFADGVFAEYAVFTLGELHHATYPPARVVWRRDDSPAGLERATQAPARPALETPEWQVNEALTNLYVGLHRDARGERLAAHRLVQVHAVDRLLDLLDLTGAPATPRQDVFAVERGAEARYAPEFLPLADFAPGYERNRDAALAILEWLEAHADVSPVMTAAIHAAAGRRR